MNTITKRLLRTEMQTLITGYTIFDEKRSEEIRRICGKQNIVSGTGNSRREWRKHVHRMSNDMLVKITKEK